MKEYTIQKTIGTSLKLGGIVGIAIAARYYPDSILPYVVGGAAYITGKIISTTDDSLESRLIDRIM